LTNRRVRKLIGLVALGSLSVTGCTDAAGYDLDILFGYFPVLSTMRGTIAHQPHTLPRLPAPGSVPVSGPLGDDMAPFTQMQLDSVGAVLTNPLPATPEVLARGQVVYERQCSVCHGDLGDGAGSVVGPGRFPSATALRDAATAGRSDGYLYGVIRVGRGLMPAYGERIAHEDRWAVVHYMRQLQGGVAAAPVVTPAGELPAQTQPGVTGEPASPPVADTAAPVGQ
jgi:mono/diheme cytochrome c family protein